jgi:hypothetical protein
VSERNTQVGKMKDIYKKAEVVAVWLGEEKDSSGIAFDTLRSIAEVGLKKTFHDGDWKGSTELECTDITRIRSIVDLFARKYWYRVWVVQETAFARKLVFSCGPEKLRWEDMEAAAVVIRFGIVGTM